MKLSDQQAQMLLQILSDSLPIVNGFTIGQKLRINLWESIIKQQSTIPQELENVTNKCDHDFIPATDIMPKHCFKCKVYARDVPCNGGWL